MEGPGRALQPHLGLFALIAAITAALHAAASLFLDGIQVFLQVTDRAI